MDPQKDSFASSAPVIEVFLTKIFYDQPLCYLGHKESSQYAQELRGIRSVLLFETYAEDRTVLVLF